MATAGAIITTATIISLLMETRRKSCYFGLLVLENHQSRAKEHPLLLLLPESWRSKILLVFVLAILVCLFCSLSLLNKLECMAGNTIENNASRPALSARLPVCLGRQLLSGRWGGYSAAKVHPKETQIERRVEILTFEARKLTPLTFTCLAVWLAPTICCESR